jgi:hypothetical protein
MPTDTATTDAARTTDRKVHLGPVVGDSQVYTMSGERDDPAFTLPVNEALLPFNDPILRAEGRLVMRMLPETALRYIPIVEARLDLNAQLLVRYPEELEELDRKIAIDEAKINAAEARVTQVVLDERTWMEQQNATWKPSGWIIGRIVQIAPELWLQSRGCLLRDTDEYRRLELLRSQLNASLSAAIEQRADKQRRLDVERRDTSKYRGRLFDLQSNVEWWQRQVAELAEPVPA